MSSQKVSGEQQEHSILSGLEAGFEFNRRNFDNPALEWRRLFSEILGTFLLVLAGAGGSVVNAVPWLRVPGYIIAQLVGSTLAVLLLRATFGNVGMLGATEPGPGISDWQAVVVEFVLTAGLVSTILGTASKAQNLGPISAFGVGAYIILAGLWSSPISGASMNPARSFGPDLVLWNFSSYWVYLVGPIAGALVAVGIAFILRGRGGGQSGIEAAQGKLN